jgi:membrane-bound lytic murein transglycosylase A
LEIGRNPDGPLSAAEGHEGLPMRAQSSASSIGHDASVSLVPLDFSDLAGFEEDDLAAAFAAFSRTARWICEDRPVLRPARPPDAALRRLCAQALDLPQIDSAARRFFTQSFRPFRVKTAGSDTRSAGFLTGYFEPLVEGALAPNAEFSAPVLARPDDLLTLLPGETMPGLDPQLGAARRLPDGGIAPYPERAAIEAGAIAEHTRPIVWLRDRLDVFLIHVQGSARILLADGTTRRLVYAGRNGQPYTSLGRVLVEAGEIPPHDMGLARLKAWIYAHGLAPGEGGLDLLLRNKSYIFFDLQADEDLINGPVGGAGVHLSPLHSIAIDRHLWPYGLPFWIAADLPWQEARPTPFRRLMIGQDTGSAILGAARADIFFGTGDGAGTRAGEIRHRCDFIVLLPRAEGDIG